MTVLDSIPEFLGFLGIEASAALPAVPKGGPRPTLELPEGTSLDEQERRLVEHLYRECRSVRLVPIGGGYSGSRVFGSFPVDRMGRREIPFVTKLDRHDRIARERVAVEGVENLLVALGDPPRELLADPALAKVHAAVTRLRELAAELLREAGLEGPVSAREYRIAQLRYSAHTLSFVEPDERQKRFALASTCLLANSLEPTLGR